MIQIRSPKTVTHRSGRHDSMYYSHPDGCASIFGTRFKSSARLINLHLKRHAAFISVAVLILHMTETVVAYIARGVVDLQLAIGSGTYDRQEGVVNTGQEWKVWSLVSLFWQIQ